MSVGDVQESTDEGLGSFYDYLFDDRQGYAYAAIKEYKGQDEVFKTFFFVWPQQKNDLINFTLLSRSRGEVYVAPSLFSEKDSHRSNVIGASMVWVELDDPPPTQLPPGVPPPTCRVASGGEGHEHWYWKLDTVLNSDQLELVNRALTYALNADPSGAESNQILRPPNTFNHKRKRGTSLIEKSEVVLSPAMFGGVPNPPPKDTGKAEITYIPPINEVLTKYSFAKTVIDLFQAKQPADRSDALMALGYHCAEMGMAQAEIMAMLVDADDRWGKFLGRDDRMQRLTDLMVVAVTKYPNQNGAASLPSPVDLTPLGFRTLLHTEVNLEWQWDGYLQRGGYFLLTGPTGVGKTQFSLNAGCQMALGKKFLGKDTRQSRIGFFSLEMGLVDLKFFLQRLQNGYTLQEQDVLEENLLFFPLGEPLYMTNDNVRATMDQIAGDLKLDGIIVDSLGSASEENVSDEKFKQFFHWNDQFRQRHDVFTWYIHHHRKANGNNRKPNSISDVYGSQYITSYATSVVCLWDGGLPNVLEYRTLKKRLAAKDAPFYIARDEKMHFTLVKPGFTGTQPVLAPVSPVQDLPHDDAGAPGPGQQGAAQTAWSPGPAAQITPEAMKAGTWSTGPKGFSDLEGKGEFSMNLNMGDIK